MVTYEIDLSVDADYMYSAPAMKQYDSESRQLRMRLFDRHGENIVTKQGQKYRIRGLKPDGQPVYVKADTEGEYVVYTLDPQVLTAVGTVLMDVEILKADDESFLLSSQLIAIEVEPAALSHEKLKSDSVITAIAGIGADTIASERVIAAIAEKARKQEKLLDGIEAAEKARQQAEEGRATAEGKRAEGESARAEAESGRSTAEEERAKKEEERKGAESSRQEAEATRAEAERLRSESEKVRAGAEDTRANAESTRAAAESSRLDAEKVRETAEEGRKTSESSRVDAESRRSDAETKRATAEDARAGAEEARATSESLRASAESARAQEETARQGQEAGRKDAEEKRVEAESARASSEQTRAESESKRQAAEVLRKSAESEREAAEAKRQEAEGTRKDAEQARASAEALREESEKARSSAESLRVSEHAASHQAATEDHAKITAVLDVIKRLETGEIVAKVADLETKCATKEEVKSQISALIGGAPQDLDTLKELADALKARGDTEEILTKLGSKIDRTQLDEELKQLDSKLTNLIGSKAAQSDLISGLAGKVNNADFDTYKSEATKAIADKVSASNFSAYKDEVAKAMTGKVPTTDFDTYKEEASKLIASKAGAAELATLKQQVGDDLQTKLDSKVDKSKIKDYTIEDGGLPKFIDPHGEVVATATKDNVFSANTVMGAIRELSKIRSTTIPSGTGEGSVVGNSTGVPIETLPLPVQPNRFDPRTLDGRTGILVNLIIDRLQVKRDNYYDLGADNSVNWMEELTKPHEKGGQPETVLSSRSVYLLIGILYNWLNLADKKLAKFHLRDMTWPPATPEKLDSFDDICTWLNRVKNFRGEDVNIVDMSVLGSLVTYMGRYIMRTIYSETQPLLLRSSFQACRDLIAGVLFPTPGAYISENVLSLADAFFTDKAAATDYWQMLVSLAFSTSGEKHDDLYDNAGIKLSSFKAVMGSWTDANHTMQRLKLRDKEYSTNKAFIRAAQKSKFVETVLTTREFTAILSKSNTAICNLWIGICKYLKSVQKKMIPDILAKENEWPSLYQKHKNLLLKRFSDIRVFYTLNVMLKGPTDSRLGHLWEYYAGKHAIESAAFPEYVQWLYKLIPDDIKHKKET